MRQQGVVSQARSKRFLSAGARLCDAAVRPILRGVVEAGMGGSGGTLRMVLGDQLNPAISSLRDLDPVRDVVLMAEVQAECTYVRHHAHKIVLVLSGMRHFAHALAARGVRVAYVRLDDPVNTQSLRGEMLRALAQYGCARVVVTEPGEWRLAEDMRHWQEAAGVEVDVRDDTRFFARIQEFIAWARGRRGLRMEFFYRDMRRRHGLLMDGDQPEGGCVELRCGEPCEPAEDGGQSAGAAVSAR